VVLGESHGIAMSLDWEFGCIKSLGNGPGVMPLLRVPRMDISVKRILPLQASVSRACGKPDKSSTVFFVLR